MLEEEKRSLRSDLEVFAAKIAILAACILFSVPALGCYLYFIISIAQGVYKRLGVFSSFLVLPLLLLAFVFMPVANGPVGIILIAFVALAFGFDIKNFVDHGRHIGTLKQKVSHHSKNE